MPRSARELSAIEVRNLKHSGAKSNDMIAVGGVPGLYLAISPTGGKSWVLRVKVADRRRDIGIGGFPAVTLAQARDKAREAREKIAGGVDPIEERKAARAALAAQQRKGLTFAEAADRYLAVKLVEFRNPKHAAQWRMTLNTYAVPEIGKMLVDDIDFELDIHTGRLWELKNGELPDQYLRNAQWKHQTLQ